METVAIYKITSPSGRVYIGQTVSIKDRFRKYRQLNCKGQPRLYASFIQYGVGNHTFEVLENCSTEEANNREFHFQVAFNVLGPNGLNCQIVDNQTEKRKVSKSTRQKLSEAHTGRKLPKSTRAKMSRQRRGRKINVSDRFATAHKQRIENNKKVLLDMQTGVFYESLKEASEVQGLYPGTLSKRVNKGRNTNLSYV